MYSGHITDVPGIAVGHMEDAEGGTGVTVVVPPAGTTAGVDVRGGGPGTRECILLRPEYAMDTVHAVVLSGGSAYGLEAASGVMRGLRADGIGYSVGVGIVPIVPSAILFDLTYKNPDVWPDMEMGLSAYNQASTEMRRQGSVGAGCGCTAAKSMGTEYVKKSGIGSAAIQVGDAVFAAIVAVNAFGNIYDAEAGRALAMPVVDGEAVPFEEALLRGPLSFAEAGHKNTTLAIVATNGKFDKTALCKLAGRSHNGLARSIQPVHTELDGDTIFSLATNEVDISMQAAGHYLPKVLARAVANGIYSVQKDNTASETI